MSNVLPSEKLAHNRAEVRAKLVLTTGLVLSAAAIAGILSLMPAFFLAYFPRVPSVDGAAVAGTENEAQRRADQETAMRIRTLLSEVTAITTGKPSPADIIAEAYAQKPLGITFAGATYTKGEPSTITILGFGKTRDDVSAYRDLLAEDPRFQKVSVPVAALVGALDGNFTITISGQF